MYKYYQGEDIPIYIRSGEDVDLSTATEVIVSVYEDNCGKEDGILPEDYGDVAVRQDDNTFTYIIPYSTTSVMKPGIYTIEVMYKYGDDRRDVMKKAHAFCLEFGMSKEY